MHQALLVSDVLLDIFAHVDRISHIANRPLSRRKSLASLAATCKAFHEPAMDLLWAFKVYGLEPLLGCVTRLHPLVYRTSRDWDPWAAGVVPLSADEARQFLRHSTRIRSLIIPSTDNRLFPLLSVIPVEACAFPRLQALTLFTTTHLGLFLSLTLCRCSVFPDNADDATPGTALVYSSIKTFDKSTADQLSLLSDHVRFCKELVTLSCPPLDWAAWKHLSNLPALVEVEVRGSHGVTPWLSDPLMINFSPFLHLTALSFSAHSAAYATAILHCLQFPSLKSFWIDVDVLTSTEAE
ncbi:hypothetical protein BDR05DRAFT_944386 [Suillus weaverae]|nr:hypothetical protein BDR05DRAFT_944386 [Suillus weaverae]